ncbi:DUF4402 domain-containing protein [Halobacteriovorax sp.]|uniref:DUF4402 domain-containing protein n=1 Tax=Halobacteriovorax sp. TaxID=2020862 RepID=UPI00356A4135
MINFLLLISSLYSFSIPITITHKQDLNFGTVVQGDPKKVISPKGSEPNNARFKIKGDINTAYTIILPSQIFISLDGAGNKVIKVNKFTSRPTNGMLNSKGKQTVKVGATLAKIGVNKPPGNYFGTFTIDVIY